MQGNVDLRAIVTLGEAGCKGEKWVRHFQVVKHWRNMNHNQRIEMTDTIITAIVKLAEGNPGAVTAMAEMAKASPIADPDAWSLELTPLFSLDTLGIYGSKIWMLFKDVCKEDAVKALALLRAVQLGLLREDVLHAAIESYGTGVDCDAILASVQGRLPNFAKPGEPAISES